MIKFKPVKIYNEIRMKKIVLLLIGLGASSSVLSSNLIDVYQQARQTNPTLRAAESTRNAAYSSVSASRASLLPQIGLSANYAHGSGYREADGQRSKSGSLGLSLSQSLFDYNAWKSLDISQQQASLQDINYQVQEQTFILTIANAYFGVLSSLDNLEYTKAQLNAFKRQMQEAKQKYDVGLVAITDVQNAKANYDLTRAELVSATNDLHNSLETLREQSGVFYDVLSTIDTKKFKTNTPADLNQLLPLARTNNLQLISSRLSVDLAKEGINLAQSGYYPTISLQASTALSKSQSYGTGFNRDTASVLNSSYMSSNTITGQNTVGVSLSMPIFSGGSTWAQTDKAKYDYLTSTEQLEASDRSVINSVSSYYNNVNAYMSAVAAYEQAVISARSSLSATESGYSVGTRTIVDVLTATTQLYSALKNLSSARYSYLLSTLQLKQATGSLVSDDLIVINDMLTMDKNIVKELTQQ